PGGAPGPSRGRGERQGVGIARPLYGNAAVLLFDESFSSRGVQNRRAILDRLFAMPGRTLVFSSHERDVVARCATIVVVERGRVLAQGSFGQLMASCPRFAELLSALDESA